ncbi:hypothetical protein [uncultured Microbulbifer sp.]|uniref:hypothetical protein n=1 Tax=uncultured Microbulbifer sp. TaxID=348147 RepID=UPI0025F527DA|nr:hypothetical protein [uncultured Microbulbifer sp.]
MTTLTDVINSRQPFESPRVRLTEKARESIADDVEAFLRRGGNIQRVPMGASAFELRAERAKCGKTRYTKRQIVHLTVSHKPDPKGRKA